MLTRNIGIVVKFNTALALSLLETTAKTFFSQCKEHASWFQMRNDGNYHIDLDCDG